MSGKNLLRNQPEVLQQFGTDIVLTIGTEMANYILLLYTPNVTKFRNTHNQDEARAMPAQPEMAN